MAKCAEPVVVRIPCYSRGRVHLNRHHLADGAALNYDDERANTTSVSAALFSPLDISDDDRVVDICPRNDVGGSDVESEEVLLK